jgi:hypothetical protein
MPESDVKLVLYFDESHNLTDDWAQDDKVPQSAYQVLCSAFNVLLKESVFIIYLSTNFNLSTFSPPRHKAWSLRSREATYALQTPIVELPFDTWRAPIVRENQLTLELACEPEFMVRFGRPL